MDVNEQIAKAYFEEIHGYVVKTNHYFKKKRKKGTGPADIDLVLAHPKDGKYGKNAICTVKGWQSHRITLRTIKNQKNFEQEWKIFEAQELEAAKKFFGSSDFTKILILPPIRREDKKEAKKYCREKYEIELLDFSDVLFELVEYLSDKNRTQRSFESEALQTLRIVLVNLLQIKGKKLVLMPNVLEHLKISKNQAKIKFSRGQLHIEGLL